MFLIFKCFLLYPNLNEVVSIGPNLSWALVICPNVYNICKSECETLSICPDGSNRTVARKFSIGGFCVCLGGLKIIKLTKTPLIHSVSRFNLGGLSPPKPPRGNGTGFQLYPSFNEAVAMTQI